VIPEQNVLMSSGQLGSSDDIIAAGLIFHIQSICSSAKIIEISEDFWQIYSQIQVAMFSSSSSSHHLFCHKTISTNSYMNTKHV